MKCVSSPKIIIIFFFAMKCDIFVQYLCEVEQLYKCLYLFTDMFCKLQYVFIPFYSANKLFWNKDFVVWNEDFVVWNKDFVVWNEDFVVST